MSNRPTHRIRFTDKATKKKYDVGVIWAPRSPMDGLVGSLSPQKQNEDGQYPKMALAEAVERHARGEGFLDVWSTAPRSDGHGSRRSNAQPQGDDGFGDGDIPF